MDTFTSRLFYATDIATMWPDAEGLFTLMVDIVMSKTGLNEADATALLNTNAAFPGRSRGTSLQRKPVKVLRGTVPHLMSAIKKVAAKAFFEKYHQLTGVGTRMEETGEGSRERRRGSRSSLVFSRNESAKCLWRNSFLTSASGCTSMQAVVAAVVSKWANIDDFLVPASSRYPEDHYRISSLLYGLLVMKVRARVCVSCNHLMGAWCGFWGGRRRACVSQLLTWQRREHV